VLIIDAAPMVHTVLGLRLSEESVLLDSAHDGEAGLKAAENIHPDLILLDVDAPALDGHQLCRRLKANPATRDIPVIVMTSCKDAQQYNKALELGALDYITKPFIEAEFKARVRLGLRQSQLVDLLAKKAMLDGVTGLWNRPYFEQRMAAEISLARRSGRPVSCLIGEVDDFAKIGEKFGHPGADELLRGVAQFFINNCRIEDVICRFGGERFGIVAPNTHSGGGSDLAMRLISRLAHKDLPCRGQSVRVTCSFGLADVAGTDPLPLIEQAEKALGRAKQFGGNRVEVAKGTMAIAR
jgi:diguanylate cyclase (GGDEF)-like protein